MVNMVIRAIRVAKVIRFIMETDSLYGADSFYRTCILYATLTLIALVK
jgi:hypothetical protein